MIVLHVVHVGHSGGLVYRVDEENVRREVIGLVSGGYNFTDADCNPFSRFQRAIPAMDAALQRRYGPCLLR